MSSEDEFELNYVKIDGKNEIKLLGADDYAAEMSTFFSTVTEYEQEKIAKKVIKDIENYIPENSELLKSNIEFAKKFLKIISANKRKKLYESINRILSVDFKNKLIFNFTNIFDICSILALFFSEIKKYKINSIEELKKRIKSINLDKHDFLQIYLDYKGLKNNKDTKSSSLLNQSRSTDNSSMKDVKGNIDTILESEEFSYNKKLDDRNLERNIKLNSVLNSESNYFKEEKHKKILAKENFLYPSCNKNKSKEVKVNKSELPIELMLLLHKLKEVTCLIFQIQNLEENFKQLSIMILSNLDWLFIKGIEEVKFDLGSEDIQQGLDKAFESRTDNLYKKYDIIKKNIYYDGSYRARAVNCWIPEGDIFFEKNIERNKEDFIYDSQNTDDCVIHEDNYIYNIYNPFGNITNIKYVIPVNYSLKNNLIDSSCILEHKDSNKIYNDEYEEFNNTIEKYSESIDIFDIDNFDNLYEQRNSLNSNNNNNINNQECNTQNNDVSNNNSTPFMLRKFSNKFKSYFKMILIYSYYFSKNLRNIKKLNLIFQSSFSYEMYICFKTNLNFDLTHFLIFLSKVETLEEANFSFNCIDDKSFEYILGILNKNTKLTRLRLSFFTPDINYYDNTLYNLCSEKKISLTKLFDDFDKYLKEHEENQNKNINDFILEEKLLNSLGINFINLSNLLKLQLLKNLEELVLRFDIPLPIMNNQSYIILIIKFLINLLIMLTFQQNKTHTVKILAPNLELNSNKMPYIRSFFKEISLSDDNKYDDINKIENEKSEDKDYIELSENEKNDNSELANKLSDSDIFSQIPQEKIDDYDINKNMENYDSSKRYKSMMQKTTVEKAAIRRNTVSSNHNENTNNNIKNNKSRKLNPNDALQNLVLQMKIYNLPEIFNICKINNLSGLKSINLGNLDEITFKGFVNDYKLNCNQLKSLTSIKINLAISVISFKDLEEYILEYININTPKLEEKFLLSNLKINDEEIMKELIKLIYLKADLEKIILTINYSDIDLLSKLLSQFIIEYKTNYSNIIHSLLFMIHHPKYKKLNKLGILKFLSGFITLNKNRMILCNENPYSIQ